MKRPTRAELLAAADGSLPDIVAPRLHVLFCGINPSVYSVAVGHHFARPGNRFWPALHLAGFTDRLLSPEEDGELPCYDCGLTNVVARATASAAELAEHEYVSGAARLTRTVEHFRPACLAILGVGAYRKAFGQPRAGLGPQKRRIAGSRPGCCRTRAA
jgi:double-stranded uracil-DNA glycosylase